MKDIIDIMKEQKLTFKVQRRGSVTEIYYRGQKINYKARTNRMAGIHIINQVKKEVKARISDTAYTLPNISKPKPYFYDFYSLPNIMDAIEGKDEIVAIDINNAYWDTLHKIGAIGKICHRKGLYDSKNALRLDYKLARNASIGSLAAATYIEEYVNGELSGERQIVENPYRFINYQVVTTIFNMAADVARELDRDLLFFLSDCFFIKRQAIKKVTPIIKSAEYNWKCKTITGINLVKENSIHKLVWVDGGEPKSYMFNPFSQIPSFRRETA
jgi:hypothetical protein